MGVTVYNKEPFALIDHMDSYFKEKPPDCCMVSQEGHEIQIHKELLYQTKFMQMMVKSANLDCCNCKVEIMCPSLCKQELEIVVQFLYSGKILCSDQTVCTQVLANLTQLLGFPSIDFKGTTITWPTIKNEIQEDPEEQPFISNSLSVEVKTDNDIQPDDMNFDMVHYKLL